MNAPDTKSSFESLADAACDQASLGAAQPVLDSASPPIRDGALLFSIRVAIECNDDPEVTCALTRSDPEIARLRDAGGGLLLRYACHYGASLQVMQLLLDFNPEAAQVPIESYRDDMETGLLPLHFACSSGAASVEIVELLLSRCQDAAGKVASSDRLPLHHALMHCVSPR